MGKLSTPNLQQRACKLLPTLSNFFLTSFYFLPHYNFSTDLVEGGRYIRFRFLFLLRRIFLGLVELF